MSEPAWVALGAQPVDYEGAWAAGTQYAPGDVVRYNGVDYLAVNPSLGSTPPVAAGAVGQWLSYTPVLTGATTNPTLGAGATADGRYVQIGKTVIGSAVLHVGTTGYVNGAGEMYVSLPVPCVAAMTSPILMPVGTGYFRDPAAGLGYVAGAFPSGASKVKFQRDGADLQVFNATYFTAGGRVMMTFAYEAA